MRRLARRLSTLGSALSLLLFVGAAVVWAAHEAAGRPLVKGLGHDERSGRFLAVDGAAVVYATQWVVPVDENDPTLGPRGFAGAASFGDGRPNLSEYHALRNGAGRAVLQWRTGRRTWLPDHHRLPTGWVLEAREVRRVGADGRGHLVRVGWRFHNSHVAIPLWMVMAVTAALPAFGAVRRASRRRRQTAGRCPACGYDLRASPGRCPECGAEAPSGPVA